jgi:hypothetical protein
MMRWVMMVRCQRQKALSRSQLYIYIYIHTHCKSTRFIVVSLSHSSLLNLASKR